MNKISIGSLVIEVTRKCNMICDHCLRGEAENINIKEEYIENVLKQCNFISNITFTGGEPSLNSKAIEHFISLVDKYNITIGSFYIATNGKNIKEDFLVAICKLYSICDEPEMCEVNISKDYYHQINTNTDGGLLKALSFVSFRDENRTEGRWINEGYYAENFDNGRKNNLEEYYIDDNYISDGNIYLNAKGQIIAGPNWSYKSQNKYIICNHNDNLLEKIIKYRGE